VKRRVAVGSPTALIYERIKELRDWRGKMLARVCKIVLEADPEFVESGSGWGRRSTAIALGSFPFEYTSRSGAQSPACPQAGRRWTSSSVQGGGGVATHHATQANNAANNSNPIKEIMEKQL
jgi:hypothetical protein